MSDFLIKSKDYLLLLLMSYCNLYNTTPDNILDTLDKYGVAILPSLLNEQEIKNMNDGMTTYGYII